MDKKEVEKSNYESILMMGDIHGDYFFLKRYLGIAKNSLLIQVGDFGLGFKQHVSENLMLEVINDICVENNNHLLVIRGNHDDPSAWEDGSDYNKELSNILFIPDYTHININEKDVLFVGGAVSVDRTIRSEGSSWWPDEVLKPIPDKLKPCDILITHTCPSYHNKPCKVDEFLRGYVERDLDLLDDLVEERSLVDEIVEIVKPKLNVHGHFHNAVVSEKEFEWGVCKFQTLDISELLEFTKYFDPS